MLAVPPTGLQTAWAVQDVETEGLGPRQLGSSSKKTLMKI